MKYRFALGEETLAVLNAAEKAARSASVESISIKAEAAIGGRMPLVTDRANPTEHSIANLDTLGCCGASDEFSSNREALIRIIEPNDLHSPRTVMAMTH